MPMDFQQTDAAAVCALDAYCSGLALNADKESCQAEDTGSPGATERTVTVDASAADKAAVWFEILVATDVSWDAGTWTIRLNVTTAQTNITWDTLHLCRVSSGCVNQATIGSVTALGISLGTTGVKTASVSGSAQAPAAGDKVMCVLGFDNSFSMTRSFGWTPTELIDSPFTPPAPSGPPVGTLALLGVGR